MLHGVESRTPNTQIRIGFDLESQSLGLTHVWSGACIGYEHVARLSARLPCSVRALARTAITGLPLGQ